jgi:hypothetical protein
MYFLVADHEFARFAFLLTNCINPLAHALQATAVAQR